MTDHTLRHFANSSVFAPPMLAVDVSGRGWAGALLPQRQDEASETAAFSVSNLRPTEHATLSSKTILNVLKYAYVVARLGELASNQRPAPYEPTPLRWRALPRVSLLNPIRDVATLHNHTIREEVLTALYNFGAACLQAVSGMSDRLGQSPQTRVTAIRLATTAQYAFSSLARLSATSDRLANGGVSLEQPGASPEEIDPPLPLSPGALRIAVLCAHATLTNLHALHNDAGDNAENYMHLHATYEEAYEAIERSDSLPRLSVIPELAQRHVAVGRHLALGTAYLEKQMADGNQSGYQGVFASLGKACFEAAGKSVEKGRQVVNIVKGNEALLVDPLVLARNQLKETVSMLTDSLGEPGIGVSAEARVNAHALISDAPTFGDLPWGDHEWPDVGFERHFAKKALACAKLLGATEDTEGILEDLVIVLGEAVFDDLPPSRTPRQENPPLPPPTPKDGPTRPGRSPAELVASLPEHQQRYGTLLLALRRYSGLQKRLEASVANTSEAARLPIFAERCKVYRDALSSIRRMMCVIFLRQDPRSTKYRPNRATALAQKQLIDYLAANPDTNRFDAIIHAYRADPLSKSQSAMPGPEEPHFDLLMSNMNTLRAMLALLD